MDPIIDFYGTKNKKKFFYKFTFWVLSVNFRRNCFIKSTPERHRREDQGEQVLRAHQHLRQPGQVQQVNTVCRPVALSTACPEGRLCITLDWLIMSKYFNGGIF
jgi:hypothetical protein